MNLAIFLKTLRDARLLLIITSVAVALLEFLFVGALGAFFDDIRQIWFQREFFQRFARMLLGGEMSADFSLTGLMTLGFAHPILLGLIWAYVLTSCSRVIVGEIERGTADILLTLPVSRTRIYATVSIAWMLAGIPICLCVPLGIWLGRMILAPEQTLELDRLMPIVPNLYALYLCLGSVTMMASAMASRRGPAIAAVLAWLLGSLLMNFLGQFWTVAKTAGALGPLHYYQPLMVLQEGAWPVRDALILLAAGAVAWCAGWAVFARRDIPAA